MKNNEISREPKLFSGAEAYAETETETEGEADQDDASVPARGTAKTQGLVNGLP